MKKAVKRKLGSSEQPQPPKSTTMEDLPDTVVTSIFSLLPMKERVRIERVSKRWQRLAKHHAWASFNTLCLHFDESLPAMKDFHGGPLGSEDGDYDTAVHDWLYSILRRCGPHLREIALFDPPIRLETFALLSLAPNVQHLSLTTGDDKGDPALNDGVLKKEIGRSLGDGLKAIHFEGIKATDAKIHDFRRFTEMCPLLECLSVHNCPSMQLWERFADGIDGAIFPHLKVFQLDLSFDALPLLEAVAKAATQLASFTLLRWERDLHPLFRNGELPSDSIVKLIGEMTGLKHLAVRSSYLENESLVRLLKAENMGSRLESLELSSISLELLELILADCLNIVHLALDLTDIGVPISAATGLKKLRFLSRVGHQELTAITASSKNLEFLDITLYQEYDEISTEFRQLIRDFTTLNHVHVNTLNVYTMIRLAMDERLRAERNDGVWPLSTLQLCLDEVPSHLPQHPHIRIAELNVKKHTADGPESDKHPPFHVGKCRMPQLEAIKYGKDLSGGIPSFLVSRDCSCGFC